MRLLLNIVITSVIALGVFVGAYKFFPLQWLETAQQSHTFGSTITTIQGSDTLSSSRTVINTNFANLNADKIEATQTTLNSLTSASSLASVGTLTVGTWNASTITAPFGGTGSTTLSSNQLLIGNGTGNIKTVTGWGNSGQFLTSNGSTLAPTWQSGAVDQTASYNWTGSSFGIKTLVSSSTIQINNGGAAVSLNFPTSQGAIGTTLQNDGSGNLSWGGTPRYTLTTNTNFGATNSFSTSTPLNIPAGWVTSSSTIEVTGNANCALSAGSSPCTYYLRTGTGVTLGSFSHTCTSPCNTDATFTFKTVLDNSLSAQVTTLSGTNTTNVGTFTSIANASSDMSSSFNMASAFSLVLVAQGPANTTPTVYNFSIVINK